MKKCMIAMSVVLVLTCMVATVVAAKAAKTAEEQQVDPLQALATAKAKAEAAVNLMSPAADPVKTGYSVLYSDIQDVYNKVWPLMQKVIMDESAKAFVEQNASLLQKAKDQSALIADEWAKYTKVWPMLNSRQADAQTWAANVATVFNSLNGAEPYWKTGKMDLALLKAAYEAVEKRAQEVTEVLNTVLAEHKRELKKWQALADEARAAVTTQPAK